MMNILLSANTTAYPGLEVVLYSLLTHNKNCRIYIFTMDIDVRTDNEGGMVHYVGVHNEPFKSRIQKIVNYLDPRSKVTFIDCQQYYRDHLWGNPNELSAVWLTPYTSLRLFSDIILKKVSHILYLDCDTAIMSNIEDMYMNCCRQPYEYAAYVCDEAREGQGEMVAGVMLMNLDIIRKTGFLEAARNNVMKTGYRWYDQDAIRETGVKPYRLPEEYAYMHELYKLNEMPKIIHFTNGLEKIYGPDREVDYKRKFYSMYPFLNYIKEGLDLMDTINF